MRSREERKRKFGASPLVPCVRCMRNLPYEDAFAYVGHDVAGFAHGDGLCDPMDIAAVKARSSWRGKR